MDSTGSSSSHTGRSRPSRQQRLKNREAAEAAAARAESVSSYELAESLSGQLCSSSAGLRTKLVEPGEPTTAPSPGSSVAQMDAGGKSPRGDSSCRAQGASSVAQFHDIDLPHQGYVSWDALADALAALPRLFPMAVPISSISSPSLTPEAEWLDELGELQAQITAMRRSETDEIGALHARLHAFEKEQMQSEATISHLTAQAAEAQSQNSALCHTEQSELRTEFHEIGALHARFSAFEKEQMQSEATVSHLTAQVAEAQSQRTKLCHTEQSELRTGSQQLKREEVQYRLCHTELTLENQALANANRKVQQEAHYAQLLKELQAAEVTEVNSLNAELANAEARHRDLKSELVRLSRG